jgi:hypothetical protein
MSKYEKIMVVLQSLKIIVGTIGIYVAISLK